METRTYELTFTDNTPRKRITIPADWKVTYGNLHPGQKGNEVGAGGVLRVYETETKQRIMMRNVASLYDTSCPMEVLDSRVTISEMSDGSIDVDISEDLEWIDASEWIAGKEILRQKAVRDNVKQNGPPDAQPVF